MTRLRLSSERNRDGIGAFTEAAWFRNPGLMLLRRAVLDPPEGYIVRRRQKETLRDVEC